MKAGERIEAVAIPLIDGTSGTRLPLKPAFGLPCNGCGYCCATAACGVALQFIPDHPEDGPCRAMEYEGGRFVCGMIRHPSRYMPDLPNDWADAYLGQLFAEALGAGRGCDADDVDTHLSLGT